jgi:hypothetical protein
MRNLGYRYDMYIIVVPGLYDYYFIPYHYLPRPISLLFHSFPRLISLLVFKGPVQSGFWTLIGCNRNRNRFGPHPQILTTRPNRTQPVHIGLVGVCKLVLYETGLNWLRPVRYSVLTGLRVLIYLHENVTILTK